MTDLLRALEAIEIGKSWILAAAIAGLAVALLSFTRRAPAFHASDRSVPPLLNGLAGSAALLSAAPFLSLAGLLYSLGSDGLAWLIGLGGGLVLMGVLIAPGLRASGSLSVSDFLAARYGGRLVPLLATLVIGGICFALLMTQLAVIGAVVESNFAIHRIIAIAWTALLLAVAVSGGGARAVTAIGASLAVLILVAYLAPLGAMTLARHGLAVGALSYGQTLSDVRELEVELISSGLADAASLKPHLSQFLQVDHGNTLALIVTVMAGTAVLPHVLMRQAMTAGVAQTRLSMAWLMLVTAAVLSAVPAYAALSKHEVYRLVAQGIPLTEVPEVFADENVAVHGVPLSLYSSVIRVLHPPMELQFHWTEPWFTVTSQDPVDGNDAAAVAEALRQTASPQDFAAWTRLSPEVHQAMLGAAKDDRLKSEAARFERWRKTVLPAAATAAGNPTGKLTQSAIAVTDDTAVIFGMKLAGLDRAWIALFALGAVLAAFATALAAAWTVARCLGADLPRAVRGTKPGAAFATTREESRTWPVRIAGVLVALCALAAVLVPPTDAGTMLAWSLSILAAGLFPALVMGIWWRRTSTAGALAGMVTGLAVTLAYIGGTHLAPHAMPQLALPSAGETGHDDPMTLADPADPSSAADAAAPAEAESAFGGDPDVSPPVPGAPAAPRAEAANPGDAAWFGIHNHAAAVFGLPLGFLVLILVSLMSRPPTAAAEHFVWAVRRPDA